MAENDGFYEEVGRLVRKKRTERRMTQEELGAAISLTRTSITNIERGRQKLLLHTLTAIAEALRVAPGDLLPDNTTGSESKLDRALQERPQPEREWIKTALNSARTRSDK